MYHISLKLLTDACPGVFRWCLDYPRHEQRFDTKSLMGSGLMFQGWVLGEERTNLRPFVKLAEKKIYLGLDFSRPDVVRKVLDKAPEGHSQLRCGFRTTIPIATDNGVFGFENAGIEYDLIHFSVEGSLKILEGRDGWLFLDNDTNQSVEQFCGKLLLDRLGQQAWLDYLDSLQELAKKCCCAYAVLIAPAKEMVMSDYYPYPKGLVTPIEQVEKLARPDHKVVNPAERMRVSKERMFRVCDTHWTHRGALCGLMAILETLGLDVAGIEKLFEKDKFKKCLQAGDLGNKIFPKRAAQEWVLSGISYRKWVQYDNHLPNIGRVIITQKKDALISAKCLIFGSSSSYTMLDYIARVFSDLVFVHSAGNIDISLVTLEKPDFLIAQTNSRFVIRPPVVGYQLADVIMEKWSELGETDHAEVAGNQAHWVKSGIPESGAYYHSLFANKILLNS
ncbi:hypothetical protein [Microbulbifer variabilis]|uniref:hypothetical protein n=1 Tax=Microbulbifer variabilis TaxID=266805 RepID=UPI001CFC4FCB|nr:hypothetical protein [Microbulbifer variabilis]